MDWSEFVNISLYPDEDSEFTKFVKSLPDKHWVKYDLSAVRLGWEAQKKLATARRENE